jgi:hypothetical protein
MAQTKQTKSWINKIYFNLKTLTMKLINRAVMVIITLLTVLFWGCKDEMAQEDLMVVPTALSNVSVKNIPGGIEVYYNQFVDKNVMLVSAEYLTDEGGKEIKRFDIKKFESSFVLTGLSSTKRALELYTISYSGVRSESVFVDIKPLLSPTLSYLQDVLETIGFVGIPKGIAFDFENPDKKALTFVVEIKGGDNVWKEYARFDTEEMQKLFLLKGFVDMEYRVYVKYTATESVEKSTAKNGDVIALVEVEVNKGGWKLGQFTGDNWEPSSNIFGLANLWDKNFDMLTAPRFENKNLPLPHSFTIDLGVNQNLALSAIKIYQHSNFLPNVYTQYNPKTIEVWGSNNPDADGGWNTWTKLVTCTSQMPSGGPKTASDLAYLQTGELYSFPLFSPVYRYLRFKVLDTWTLGQGQSTSIRLSEITLYGVQGE